MDAAHSSNLSQPLTTVNLAGLPAEIKLAILTVPMPRYRSFALARTCRAFYEVYLENIDAIRVAEYEFCTGKTSGSRPRRKLRDTYGPPSKPNLNLELLRELPNVDGRTGTGKKGMGSLGTGLMEGRPLKVVLFESGRMIVTEKE